jgi:hypothetical protein
MLSGCGSLLAMLALIVIAAVFGLNAWLLAAIITLAALGYACLLFGAP